MQRVLDQGYATTAQITGAQFQRTMPFAADGWRPRFVEQDLSVDLSWQGKDGKAHELPEGAGDRGLRTHSIVSGDQVRLVTLPVKVLDDDTAVPVITADTTAARLPRCKAGSASRATSPSRPGRASLRRRLFGRRQAAGISAAAAKPIDIPPRRTLLGLVPARGRRVPGVPGVVGGPRRTTALVGGKDIVAEITVPRRPPSHAVRLRGRTGRAASIISGRPAISEAFWNKITQNGQLSVRQTPIRVRDDDPAARPVMVDDAPESTGRSDGCRLARRGPRCMLVVGAGCLLSAARNCDAKQGSK